MQRICGGFWSMGYDSLNLTPLHTEIQPYSSSITTITLDLSVPPSCAVIFILLRARAVSGQKLSWSFPVAWESSGAILKKVSGKSTDLNFLGDGWKIQVVIICPLYWMCFAVENGRILARKTKTKISAWKCQKCAVLREEQLQEKRPSFCIELREKEKRWIYFWKKFSHIFFQALYVSIFVACLVNLWNCFLFLKWLKSKKNI